MQTAEAPTPRPWPAPWHARQVPNRGNAAGDRWIIATGTVDRMVYSELAELSFTSQEAGPTAHLMADSPDLLKALASIIDNAARDVQEMAEIDGADHPEVKEAKERVEAAFGLLRRHGVVA